MAHQNRPLPDWPQIVSINSIVSLFSMMIRAGVSMVLAEGMSEHLQISKIYSSARFNRHRYQSVEMAMVP
jgi:hypothetical protein